MSKRVTKSLIEIAAELADAVDRLRFSPPVRYVYNPLRYAWAAHAEYLRRYGGLGAPVLLLGMNPGPWGMAQTGVPFGEVRIVRDWLGIRGEIGRPAVEHPKRPVEGLRCKRSEVSGQRLWGWARERYGEPERFFQHFFVGNYCPLAFLEESGRNLTPDHLPAAERAALQAVCDAALARVIAALRPVWVIGVGQFAESRAKALCGGDGICVGGILHPSPASPLANRGWAEKADEQLRALGIEVGRAKFKVQSAK
jgi:single-strand selective monofunctional uracil DNA glycosylase